MAEAERAPDEAADNDVFALMRARLHQHPPTGVPDPRTGRPPEDGRSDFDLNPDMRSEWPATLRAAAVLIPIVARTEPSVLLTRRAAHLPHHPGQISFPGGKIEDRDGSALAAALRETHEEIGLSPERIVALGYLDPYVTRTGFHVTPVVATVATGYRLTLDPREVDAAFEVPLAFLLNPDNHEQHSREWRGKQRRFYAMPYGDHYIWGATAGMIKNLYDRLHPQ